ncbi:hypothetical protein, partial [Vibrio sp. M260118]|uniref:hypothetical protein n=1 Tax=Vibrio sp. M260118 TaxID=3020896 RepID=UPI002F3F7505
MKLTTKLKNALLVETDFVQADLLAEKISEAQKKVDRNKYVFAEGTKRLWQRVEEQEAKGYKFQRGLM